MIWEIANNSLKRRLFDNEQLSLNSLSDDISINEIDGNLYVSIALGLISDLSEDEKRFLGLPDSFPYDIVMESENTVIDKTFRIYETYNIDYPSGLIINGNRNECLINTKQSQYLIDYELSQHLDKITAINTGEREDNYFAISEVQKIQKTYPIKSSREISLNTIEFLNEIKLDFEENNDGINLTAIIKSNTINQPINLERSIRSNYRSEDDKRIILKNKNKELLKKIKDKKNISGWVEDEQKSELADFLKNPKQFLGLGDDEIKIVNLSELYGSRVIGIGEYIPKYYSFLIPDSNNQWVPSVKITNENTGKSQLLTVKDTIEYKQLAKSYNSAQANKQDFVLWKDKEYKLEDVKESLPRLYNIISKKKNAPKSRSNQALLIDENITELTYTTEPLDIAFIDKKPTFETISNLSEDIILYDYQQHGVSHMQSLFSRGLPGILLADDMGLGKTLQVLYFLEWYAQKTKSCKPCLIIAPVSLLKNWQNEYSKFFTQHSYNIEVLTSDKVPTTIVNPELIERLSQKNILLTNYETFRNSQLIFASIDYGIIALDEAQRIKTPNTQITNAIKALEGKADFKIAMTGTPVENTLIDFWSIVDFLFPSLLSSAKTFHSTYQKPIIEDAKIREQKIKELKNTVGQLYLRRLKEDVLGNKLPTKYLHRIECKMTKPQADFYNLVIQESEKQSLTIIHKLKLICDSSLLLNYDPMRIEIDEILNSSSRLIETVNILQQIKDKQEKVIIFSEYRKTQKMLNKVILELFNINVRIINGETKNEDTKKQLSRQTLIDNFQCQKGFNVIIMSPLAAGVGLNVVGANHVIHYSRHWNPAKEAQATDRVYRIGQTKDVHVYNLITTYEEYDTFDVILEKLLRSKATLAKEALCPSEVLEVTPVEMMEQMAGAFNSQIHYSENKISPSDFNNFDPITFETAIAALFSKNGYDVKLTPKTNDKGADIVCCSSDINYLIQVKKSSSLLNISPLQEILGAIPIYERVFQKKFTPLIISNSELNANSLSAVRDANVRYYNLNSLSSILNSDLMKVSLSLIHQMESNRMKFIN